jgi:diaminopimelate decarboxylase
LTAIACHIGSQIFDINAAIAAARCVAAFADDLKAAGVAYPQYADLGGGFGVAYRGDETLPDLEKLDEFLAAEFVARRKMEIVLEPGRAIAAPAGVLLARVEYLKKSAPPDGGDAPREFAVVDAAMNDLPRPALYDAYHRVLEVAPVNGGARRRLDVVGPICESADVLARGRELAINAGDLIAIADAGAYAMAMSSNYNARPRPCEALIDGKTALLIRRRETPADLFAPEQTPDYARLRAQLSAKNQGR